MTIAVYIDSCAWNYLYEHCIDLSVHPPSSRYSIYITREVEIELDAIPEIGCDGSNKTALKNYILHSINQHPVRTSYIFGFASVEPDGSLSPMQVYGGFGEGVFQSPDERDFYAKQEIKEQLIHGKKMNSGLGKNEADASLAAKSLSFIVLTNEKTSKNGPLKLASEIDGKVVYL